MLGGGQMNRGTNPKKTNCAVETREGNQVKVDGIETGIGFYWNVITPDNGAFEQFALMLTCPQLNFKAINDKNKKMGDETYAMQNSFNVACDFTISRYRLRSGIRKRVASPSS